MEQWKEYKISEIIEEIAMGPFGSNIKVDNFIDFGIPVLNGSNLQGFKLKEDSFNYVSEDKADSLGRANAFRGDVVITHRGTLGQIVYIPLDSKHKRYVISQSQFRLKLNQNLVRPDFFVYFFHTRLGQHRILVNASQVGVPALARPTSTFKEVSIPVPPIEMQNKIMAILHSLDDKIELNHRINDNLEQQAQALFKAWFVDFEPFKDGEFVDDEFGRRPYRWQLKPLEYLVEQIKSGDWGKDEQIGNYTVKTFCMRGADFPDVKEGNKGKMPVRYILEKNYNEKSLNEGNVVVEISGGSPTQSTGRIVLIDKAFIADCNNALICTNFCKSLEIKEGFSLFFYLLWQYLYDNKVMFIYENGSNGLKNLNINNLIRRESFVIPPKDVILRFNSAVLPLLSKKQVNGVEVSRLTSLRDTILPKLMSGELKMDATSDQIFPQVVEELKRIVIEK